MSIDKKIYMGPFLQVNREAMEKTDSHIDELTGGGFAEVRDCCDGYLDDRWIIAIPNKRGLDSPSAFQRWMGGL